MPGDRYQSGDCDRYGDRVEPTNRTTAVHPYLLAMLPLLAAWQLVFPHVVWRELLVPATLLLVPAFGLVIGLSIFVADRQRAALAASWLLLCFFGQGLLASLAGGLGLGAAQLPPLYLALGLIGLGGLGLWVILKAEWCDESMTLFANMASVAAVVAIGGALGWQYYSAWNNSQNQTPVQVASVGAPQLPAAEPSANRSPPIEALHAPAQPPDIYCLVFHRYAGPASLEKYFRFDSRPFRGRMEKAGFVFPRMPAAGDDAPRVLAGLLNLEPVSAIPAGPVALRAALRESRAARLLGTCGYRYHHLGSPLPGLRDSSLADDHYAFYSLRSELDESILRHSVLWPWLVPPGFRARELGRIKHLQRLLAAPPAPEHPQFVLAHFMIPGDEWKFDHDGAALTANELQRRKPADNYLRQVVFANRTIEQTVSAILNRPGRPAIILLVGDVPPELPPEVLFRTKGVRPPCDLLAAIYLPDANKRAKIPATVEVSDLFDLVFREYFDAK